VRLLPAGGLLVTDNVISHAHEVSEFLAALCADTVTVPLGKERSSRIDEAEHVARGAQRSSRMRRVASVSRPPECVAT